MLNHFFHEPGASLAYGKQQEINAQAHSINRQLLSWACFAAVCFLLLSCNKGADSRTEKDFFTQGDLTRAAARGDLDSVQSLLKAGANINENLAAEEGESLTPLIAAIAKEQVSVATFLIKNGAALYPSYQGYRAKEYAHKLFGANHPVTQEIDNASLRVAGGVQ